MLSAPPNGVREVLTQQRVVRVVFPHGFVDEQGKCRFWQAGQHVLDAEELALLRKRGAELQEE